MHCSYCDSEEHTVFYCPRKPKSGLSTFGPYAQKMAKVRREWFVENKPDHSGYYYCGLCGKALLRNEVELDHKLSRSRHPDLRYDITNLRSTCHDCNFSKGSKDIEHGFFE